MRPISSPRKPSRSLQQLPSALLVCTKWGEHLPTGIGRGGDPILALLHTHQDVELEPVTVLLPGEQHQSLLCVPLSALVQVSPRRVPALVDGDVVPQRWKESSVRASPQSNTGAKTGLSALQLSPHWDECGRENQESYP